MYHYQEEQAEIQSLRRVEQQKFAEAVKREVHERGASKTPRSRSTDLVQEEFLRAGPRIRGVFDRLESLSCRIGATSNRDAACAKSEGAAKVHPGGFVPLMAATAGDLHSWLSQIENVLSDIEDFI